MNRKFPQRRSFEDVKCIWMKNGIVDYRLCDNDFRCENCPFNMKIENEISYQKNKNVNDNIQFFFNTLFDTDKSNGHFQHPYYHFKNGLILKHLVQDNYYIGFENYVTNVIDGNCSLKYYSDGNFVTQGDKIIEVSGSWGVINVISPISMIFVEKFNLSDLISEDKRWFGIIETNKTELMQALSPEEFYIGKVENSKTKIREYIINVIDNPAGETMYDGGKMVTNLLFAIGADNYRNILKYILLG